MRGVFLLLLLLLVAFIAAGCAGAQAQEQRHRPNIIFVMSNDQDAATLQYMPYTGHKFKEQATTYPNATYNYTLCCPSRASILRGQYTHNHKIWANVPPLGGYDRFKARGLGKSTLPLWLDRAGYRTGMFGQYVNGYDPRTDTKPPGWDKFVYYGRDLDGTPNAKGVYYDEAVKNNAVRWVRVAAKKGPFFAWISFNAPHYPYNYDPKYKGRFRDARLPRPPSFNEKDVSDKPDYVGNWPRMDNEDIRQLTSDHRNRLRGLLTVDNAMKNLVRTVDEAGELNNTYIVYWTDNGYMMGQHRLKYKRHPYIEALSHPMLIRGPGIYRGVTDERIIMNQDLAPTFADIARADTPAFVDGRSMKPIFGGKGSWRDVGMIEASNGPSGLQPSRYAGLRDETYTYVEYATGEREFYDLQTDHYQLENIAGQKPELEAELSAKLQKLKDCVGAACRVAENTAP